MKVQKQNKIFYYFKGFVLNRVPVRSYQKEITRLRRKLSAEQLKTVEARVNYYNKLQAPAGQLIKGTKVKDLVKPVTPKSYFFDTYEYARHFDKNLPIDWVFGDVTHVPESPSIVKSRPISHDNQNSVVLNLDKARHFVFVKGDRDFAEKKNLMIGRAAVQQPHRYAFYEKYFGHPLADLGQINTTKGNPDWIKPKISIDEHLKYKFILSLQGYDVATNLKWIMSSNSIAVMPKPSMETWYMEGTLVPGKHFIEIGSDYSDFEEKINYYIENEAECREIIENAHQYVNGFFNQDVEDLCSLLVLEKYFQLTQ